MRSGLLAVAVLARGAFALARACAAALFVLRRVRPEDCAQAAQRARLDGRDFRSPFVEVVREGRDLHTEGFQLVALLPHGGNLILKALERDFAQRKRRVVRPHTLDPLDVHENRVNRVFCGHFLLLHQRRKVVSIDPGLQRLRRGHKTRR